MPVQNDVINSKEIKANYNQMLNDYWQYLAQIVSQGSNSSEVKA